MKIKNEWKSQINPPKKVLFANTKQSLEANSQFFNNFISCRKQTQGIKNIKQRVDARDYCFGTLFKMIFKLFNVSKYTNYFMNLNIQFWQLAFSEKDEAVIS